MSPKPECCGCGVKFYAKPQNLPWKLMHVDNLKGKVVPSTYTPRSGMLCGLCLRKAVLGGFLDTSALET